MGEIDEDKQTKLSTYFYDLPSTNLRRNGYTYPARTADLRVVNLQDLFSRADLKVSAGSYVYPGSHLCIRIIPLAYSLV